ncbi:MAG: hypothetical protein LAQ30_04900 [Acidobacteriia bacterium]|nr:hypothetical protein [Terriglobia bacterium]
MALETEAELRLNVTHTLVWVAKNDQGKSLNGQTFAALKRLPSELAFNFDAAVNKTIEIIDGSG